MKTGSAVWPTRERRSPGGSRTTTKRGRTAACSTVRPRSLLRSQRQASTPRMWGKEPQTPAPCPTPPSPLRQTSGANKNRRKSHYPWTNDGGQVTSDTHGKRYEERIYVPDRNQK